MAKSKKNELVDLKSPKLSEKEKRLISDIITLALNIVKLEGDDVIIVSDTIEHAINLVVLDVKSRIDITTNISKLEKLKYNTLVNEYPNYHELINNIGEIFSNMDENQLYNMGTSVTLAAFIGSLRKDATASQSAKIYNKKIKSIKIVLTKEQKALKELREQYPITRRLSDIPSESSESEEEPVKPKKRSTPATSKPKKRQATSKPKKRSTISKPKKLSTLEKLKPKKRPTLEKPKPMKSVTFLPKEEQEIPLKKIGETTFVELKKHPKKKESVPESEEKPHNYLSIKRMGKNGFIVYGLPIKIYEKRLLELGGKYSKLKGSEVRIENTDVIVFEGRSLDRNKDTLLSMGGVGIGKKQDRIEFRGKPLLSHRNVLLGMGGKYGKKLLGTIRFSTYFNISNVEDIVFESLPPAKKYNHVYRKWAIGKIKDILDTSMQLSVIMNDNKISEPVIEIAIEGIYGCNIPEDALSVENRYALLVKNIMNEYSEYKIDKSAIILLSKYITYLGNILTAEMEEHPQWDDFEKRLDDIGIVADNLTACENVESALTQREICFLKALRRIAAYLKNVLAVPMGNELCMKAFMIFITTKRMSAKLYVIQTFDIYQDWMDDNEIETRLREQGINYKLSDIRKIIKLYDDKSLNYASGILCDNVQKCDECVVMFAIILHYISGDLKKPNISRRAAILGSADQ